jgi:hypothetical protein
VLAALGRLQGAQDPILAALSEDAAETGRPGAEAAGGAAPDTAVLRALGAAQQATAPAAVAVLALRLLEASEPEALPGDMALDAALRALVQAGLEKAAVEVGVAAMIADATAP